MNKVASYDFSRYQQAMVSREGHGEAESDASWRDLKIILRAMEQDPDKAFALTVGADMALHGLLLDTVGALRFAGHVYGDGSLMVHDPFCYGTAEFDAAWANTRAAFAAEGVELLEDYRAAEAGALDAEACVLKVDAIDSLRKAEACVFSVKKIEDLRKAEACVFSVKKIDELRAAEACVLAVKSIDELRAAESCVLAVKKIDDLHKAEACVLSVGKLAELQAVA